MPDFLELYRKKEPPVQKLEGKGLYSKGIELYVQREDLLHPELSGNKWRKLKYNLIAAKEQGHRQLLSFGGAYSNHIYALAAAGRHLDFQTIGIIRGEADSRHNSTLQFAQDCGMRLHFVDRSVYRRKTDPLFLQQLRDQFGPFYLLPEGGSNALAVQGCSEIINERTPSFPFDVCCVAAGTGGTAAGILHALQPTQRALVFSALKGDFLQKDIEQLLADFRQMHPHSTVSSPPNWQLITDYHFGGYAKFTPDLVRFINDFKANYGIPLEPIYTGKMLFGLFDLIAKDHFPKGTRILAIHTGGLQGLAGFRERFGIF
ncbi:MAG: pyridoxal-phosphate dependent enzyme [Bacteroidota bacterium]